VTGIPIISEPGAATSTKTVLIETRSNDVEPPSG